MWSTIGASARCHPRAQSVAAGAGGATCGPLALPSVPLRSAWVRVPASRPRWRVLVWLITGKHAGREARTRRTRTVLQPLTTTVHVYNYISCTFYLLCVRHVP